MFSEISTASPALQGDDHWNDDTGLAALKTLKRGQDAERQKATRKATQISFARGRIKAILAGIERESRRCFDPVRGRAIFDVLLPYAFEAYVLEDDASFEATRDMVSYWLPGIMAEIGRDGYGAAWDHLASERSIAAAAQFANPLHRGKALNWLPRAEEITKLFGLTREARDAINERQARHGGKPAIIGIPVIDPFTPEEKLARQRACMTAKRRRDGVKAQSERTITKTLQGYADRAGVSLDTIKRQRKNDTLDTYLAARGVCLDP